jgi:hypothetical protein
VSPLSNATRELISPTVDAALRHLAFFWGHRRHVHHFFALGALPDRADLQGPLLDADVPNITVDGRVMLPSSDTGVQQSFVGAVHGPAASTINTNPITSEPLFVIVAIGIALLVVDLAFGGVIYARASKATGDTPPKPSTPELSTPSTPEEIKDANDEWEYFRRTKCRVLLLSMVLGFASEFLLWMLAPFFPLEAINRSVSTEVVGLVFACHPIALGISSQLAPWLMRNVSPSDKPSTLPRAAAAAPSAPSHRRAEHPARLAHRASRVALFGPPHSRPAPLPPSSLLTSRRLRSALLRACSRRWTPLSSCSARSCCRRSSSPASASLRASTTPRPSPLAP